MEIRNRKNNKKTLLIWGLVLLSIIIIVVIIRYFSLFWGLAIDKSIDVKKNKQGNINILLMGKGGGTHEGPDLTDTIILASINPEKNRIDMVSIPRDFYVKSMGRKINSAYAIGQEESKGILYSKSIVESITNIRPDYAIVLDFSGFVKLVDLLGGIDVKVKNTLDDYAYPVEGLEEELCGHTEDGIASFSAQIATASATEFDIFPCRFEHLHVEKGRVHMDGKLALKFVRSRHALGGEGSDFARSARQQEVLSAIREKVLSLGTLTNPLKVVGIIGILKDNISTDIKEVEYDDFIKLAQKMRGANINSYVLDIGNEGEERYGLLVNPPITEGIGWVLTPRVGISNYSEIKEYVKCIFSGNTCVITKGGISEINPSPFKKQ